MSHKETIYFWQRMRAGITLVEILIVMVLLAILAILLSQGFTRAKRVAAQTKDVAHLRGIWTAAEQFSQEHQGYILPCRLLVEADAKLLGYNTGAIWLNILKPYLGGSTSTPSSSISIYVSPGNPARNLSYSPNAKVQVTVGGKPRKKVSITAPARFLFIGNHRAGSSTSWASTNYLDSTKADSLNLIPEDWYANGRANFLFLDGHVESIPVEDLKPGGQRFSAFTPELK